MRTLLDDRELPAAFHARTWDGLDARGIPVASGVYFYTLAGESGRQVVKLIVAR